MERLCARAEAGITWELWALLGESSAVQHFTRPSASSPALGKKLGSNLDYKSEPQSKHITADMKLEDTKLMFPNEKTLHKLGSIIMKSPEQATDCLCDGL